MVHILAASKAILHSKGSGSIPNTQAPKERKQERRVFGGWSMFTIPTEDPEQHGLMMEYQTDSRERFIKETAKKAGASSNY